MIDQKTFLECIWSFSHTPGLTEPQWLNKATMDDLLVIAHHTNARIVIAAKPQHSCRGLYNQGGAKQPYSINSWSILAEMRCLFTRTVHFEVGKKSFLLEAAAATAL